MYKTIAFIFLLLVPALAWAIELFPTEVTQTQIVVLWIQCIIYLFGALVVAVAIGNDSNLVQNSLLFGCAGFVVAFVMVVAAIVVSVFVSGWIATSLALFACFPPFYSLFKGQRNWVIPGIVAMIATLSVMMLYS